MFRKNYDDYVRDADKIVRSWVAVFKAAVILTALSILGHFLFGGDAHENTIAGFIVVFFGTPILAGILLFKDWIKSRS